MKICILTPRFPFPEAGGDLLRINNIARHLKDQGHRLILVSYIEQGRPTDIPEALFDSVYTVVRSRLASLVHSITFLLRGKPIQCGYYYSRGYRKLFRRVVREEQPDLYVSHLIRMLPFVEKEGVERQTIVEMTDTLSKTYQLSAKAKGSIQKRLMYAIERRTIGPYELAVARKYPKTVLVSEADAAYLRRRLGDETARVAVYGNGVATASQPSVSYDADKICFIGNMVTLQNQDAVIYFVEQVFPEILKKRPTARFYVVGNRPPAAVQRLADNKHIFVTGYVEDMEALIADSCVAVAPVNMAAGIQNKVLVAMANRIPVVLSSLIALPIPELQDGGNCYICDAPQAYAACCLRLMDDRRLRDGMAQKGYDMVSQHYVWSARLSGYETLDAAGPGASSADAAPAT